MFSTKENNYQYGSSAEFYSIKIFHSSHPFNNEFVFLHSSYYFSTERKQWRAGKDEKIFTRSIFSSFYLSLKFCCCSCQFSFLIQSSYFNSTVATFFWVTPTARKLSMVPSSVTGKSCCLLKDPTFLLFRNQVFWNFTADGQMIKCLSFFWKTHNNHDYQIIYQWLSTWTSCFVISLIWH